MPNSSDHMPWGKLTLSSTCVNIKQNIDYAWLLEQYTLGKLIFCVICLSVEQNLGYVWFLGSHALDKLTFVYLFSY